MGGTGGTGRRREEEGMKKEGRGKRSSQKYIEFLIDKIKRCSLQKQTNGTVLWPCQNVFLVFQIKAH